MSRNDDVASLKTALASKASESTPFAIGARVVCVDASPLTWSLETLELGRTYTIVELEPNIRRGPRGVRVNSSTVFWKSDRFELAKETSATPAARLELLPALTGDEDWWDLVFREVIIDSPDPAKQTSGDYYDAATLANLGLEVRLQVRRKR